jgi:tetratricopeptide (TPR) repeat protein
MTKVYLSSTLLDLKEERQAVTDWLVAAGFQPVHSYAADTETVRDSCLDDIDDCELYVLIVGHRYGFQPAQRNPKQRSITELEYRKARKLKRPCLAFLRTSVPDITLSDLNEPVRYAKVQAFRAEVQNAVRPAEFKDMAEFNAALGTAIARQVMKRLKQRDDEAAEHEQRIAELEVELLAVRENAVNRVLADAAQPDAGAPMQRARQALLQGESALAEQLLREQEELAATASDEKRREAAELAREIAALATGRDSAAALAALERAISYMPGDYRAHGEFGDALLVAGRTTEALSHIRTALQLGEQLLSHDSSNHWLLHDLSVSYNKIGDVLVALGDCPGALAAYCKDLAITESLATSDPANTQWQRDLSVSHDRIGDMLCTQGDIGTYDKALASYRKGLSIREALAARNPANTQWQRDLSVSHNKIGDMLVKQGDSSGALAAYREALTIRVALVTHDSANTQWQRDLSISHERIGNVFVAHSETGAYSDALTAYRKALTIRKSLATRDQANTQWQRDLSISHEKIGDVLCAPGLTDEHGDALAAYREAQTIREALAAHDPANTLWQRDLSVIQVKIGDVLCTRDDGPGALAVYHESLAIRKALAARDPTNTQWQHDLSVSYDRIGDLLHTRGEGSDALSAYRKALAIAEALATRDPTNAEWQRDLIVIHIKLANAGEGREHYAQALHIAEAMQAKGILAPVDAWMIDDLKQRLAE